MRFYFCSVFQSYGSIFNNKHNTYIKTSVKQSLSLHSAVKCYFLLLLSLLLFSITWMPSLFLTHPYDKLVLCFLFSFSIYLPFDIKKNSPMLHFH